MQFENNYFSEMCSGFEAGSYLRLIDFVHHSTLGSSVIKKKIAVWDHLRDCAHQFVACHQKSPHKRFTITSMVHSCGKFNWHKHSETKG